MSPFFSNAAILVPTAVLLPILGTFTAYFFGFVPKNLVPQALDHFDFVVFGSIMFCIAVLHPFLDWLEKKGVISRRRRQCTEQ